MISDFLGSIGGLEFVTADQAFTEAVDAQRSGDFGKPEEERGISSPPTVVPESAPQPDATLCDGVAGD